MQTARQLYRLPETCVNCVVHCSQRYIDVEQHSEQVVMLIASSQIANNEKIVCLLKQQVVMLVDILLNDVWSQLKEARIRAARLDGKTFVATRTRLTSHQNHQIRILENI